MKRQRVRINSLYRGLYDGPHATPKPSDRGPVFLGIGNITPDGQLDLSDIRHIAEEDFSDWTKRVIPQPGDIVFTYEATLNLYAIIPEGFRGCLGRRLALIRPDEQRVNPRFLFFYFFCEDWRRTVSRNTLSGATVDRIPLTTFPSFEIDLPSRSTQDRIVSILSAYDDLIRNNTRRIKVLEQMAQMLYREWFVNFRFPGHENVGLVKSELGLLPNGWSLATLSDTVSEIIDYRGKTPKKLGSDWSDSGVIALSALNVKQGRLENLVKAKRVDDDLYSRWMKSELADGDILMTSEAPLGQLYMLTENERYCLSQRLFSIRAKSERILPSLLYMYLSSHAGQEQLTARASGTTVLGIRQSELRKVLVPVPEPCIQKKADRAIWNFLRQIEVLNKKSENLRLTRDLLLPKLVSGEVSVEQIESDVAAHTV